VLWDRSTKNSVEHCCVSLRAAVDPLCCEYYVLYFLYIVILGTCIDSSYFPVVSRNSRQSSVCATPEVTRRVFLPRVLVSTCLKFVSPSTSKPTVLGLTRFFPLRSYRSTQAKRFCVRNFCRLSCQVLDSTSREAFLAPADNLDLVGS
jgi:hypothetical protein